MLLSTNTAIVEQYCTGKEMINLFRNAGFDAIDFSFFDERWYSEDLDDTYFSELRQYAQDTGMCFNQAHAPFHTSFPDEAQTKKRFWHIWPGRLR